MTFVVSLFDESLKRNQQGKQRQEELCILRRFDTKVCIAYPEMIVISTKM